MPDTDTPKKPSTAATVAKVVILVLVIATIVSMWLHGANLGRQHARRFGAPEDKAGVLLPWHWTSDQWRSWVSSEPGSAEVTSSK